MEAQNNPVSITIPPSTERNGGSPAGPYTLVTYSTGSVMVREVLDDWMEFLSPRPRAVVVAIPGEPAPPPIYGQLRDEGRIDRLLVIQPLGRSVNQTALAGTRAMFEAAETEWILDIRLDVLPYRIGFDRWVTDLLRVVDEHGYFGFTGSFRARDLVPGPGGFSKTQRFSENFAFFRRDEFLDLIDKHLAPGESVRWAYELIVEAHLEATGNYNLFRPETPEWTVFHINQWGEDLRRIREQYRARRNIAPFMNTGVRLGPTEVRPRWEKYYGYPRPPLLKRARRFVGAWRRKLTDRISSDDR
jgi:hypothetical protein